MNNYQPPPVLLGNDLPLIRYHHWNSEYGYGYWSQRGFGNAPNDLEHLQRALYTQQQRTDEEVVINAKHRRRYVSNNKIPFHSDILPHWEAFAKELKNRRSLTRFSIDNIVLPPSFFKKMLKPIMKKNSSSMTCLELTSVSLTSKQVDKIARLLPKLPSLACLNLSSNTLDDVSASESLAGAMNNHPDLCLANFSKCDLGDNIEVLAQILEGVPNLKSLIIERNNIKTPEAIKLVADFIEDNATMTVMSLEGNLMGDDNAKILGSALEKNHQLCQLGLGFNSISDISLPSLIGSKRATEHLTHLDLSTNRWGYFFSGNEWTPYKRIKSVESAVLIAEFLECNPALIELNLRGHGMNGKAVILIASALKHNDTLEHLDLSCNAVSDASVPALVHMLKVNTSLCSLDVSSNETLKYKTGKKELITGAICDLASLAAIPESNHTCVLKLSDSGKYMNNVCREHEMRQIQMLDNVGLKIRYKVLLALFAFDTDLFHPRNFVDIPLELMPRLSEIAQQEIRYNGFGEGISLKNTTKKSGNELRRIYEVIQGWPALPYLFMRGPGKLKKKRKRKAVVDEEEEWLPTSRGSSNCHKGGRTSLGRTCKSS